jgi:hypothetical protein
MNGPEHFTEAESLAANAATSHHAARDHLLARAQVHATLALVAATLDSSAGYSIDHHSGERIEYVNENQHLWDRVIS